MENPISYASASGMQKRDAVIVLNKYMERFRWNDDDEVLDFGCGPGDITRHLLAECIPRSVVLLNQMSSASSSAILIFLATLRGQELS